MITPEDFLNKWDKDFFGLVSFDEEAIKSFSLAPWTKFLA